MIKCIIMFLFIGFAYGQTDLDKLVLKEGTTYFGEYSKTEGKTVFFKPQGAFGFQPIPVKRVKKLELKDGRVVVLDSKVKNLSLEEYQKLSTKEKAVYDANLVNMWRWAFYAPLGGGVSVGASLFLEKTDMFEVIPLPIIYLGSIGASVVAPYFLLNRKTDFSYPEAITHGYDRTNYKKVYAKTIVKRKVKYIVVPPVIIGGLGFLVFMQAMKGFSMGDGGGDWGMGGYSGGSGYP